MSEAPKAPSGDVLAVGQRWKEVDPRCVRSIEVVGWDESGTRISIRGARMTTANIKRFTGKRGGYKLTSFPV